VNSPTFNVNEGFTGNGISSYIDFNYTTVTNWINASQDNICAFAYQFADTAPSNAVLLGVASTYILVNPRNLTNQIVSRLHNSTLFQTASTNGQGLMLVNRNNSSNYDIYLRGSLITNTSVASTNVTTPIYAMRTGTTYASSKPSVVGYGASLTSQQITDLTNSINAYFL
jgi:hypothetical protein